MSEQYNSAMNTTEYKDSAMLQFAIQNGMFDIDGVAEAMRKRDYDAALRIHNAPITQGSDGRWKTHVKTSTGRKLIAKKEYDDVVYALVNHYSSQLSNSNKLKNTTLTDLFPKFIEHDELRGMSPATVKYKTSCWKNHIAKEPFAKIPIPKITSLDIENWACRLIDDHEMNSKRYFNVGGVLNQMLQLAVKMNIISKSPYQIDRDMIRRKCALNEGDSERIPVFSPAEESKFFATAWQCFGNGHHTVHILIPLAIMFQFNTGLRIGELCALRHEDVNGRILTVQRMFIEPQHEVVPYTKNYKQHREVPLNDYALMLLSKVDEKKKELGIECNGFIFSTDERATSYTEVKKAYTKYCELSKIPTRSSHSARKTFITKLVDSGRFTIAEIARMCGNSEQVIWNHYYHPLEDISNKLDSFNEVFKEKAPKPVAV